MATAAGNSSQPADATTTATNDKKFNWWLLVKIVFFLDLAFVVINTVVQCAFLDGLAHVAHYQGFGKILAMVGTGFLTFFISWFIAIVFDIVVGGGLFVLAVAAVSILGGGMKKSTTSQPAVTVPAPLQDDQQGPAA